METVVKIELSEGVELPKYNYDTDSGIDIKAMEDVVLEPGSSYIISTGIKVATPAGYEMQIRPRSGVSANTNIRIANSPATIDAGYRGEVQIILHNTSPDYVWLDDGTIRRITDRDEEYVLDLKGRNANGEKRDRGCYKINKGDRVAQMVFAKVAHVTFEQVDDINTVPSDGRGDGKLGSTGV